MRVFNIFVNITICVTSYGRGALPIYDGRLDSDLNANNFSITNLYSLDVKNVPWVTTNQLDAAIEGVVVAESDPIAYPVATNALATATNALAVAEGALQAEADTLATVTARGSTTPHPVTIGSRIAGDVGEKSFVVGINGLATHYGSVVIGAYSQALADDSVAIGVSAKSSSYGAFAWSGEPQDQQWYESHGLGTFNINPVGGLAGFYIGETNMAATLSGYATADFVSETKWTADDVATNLSYNVVVSNGHWLIRERSR